MDEQQTPAPEAGDEAVSEQEVQTSEATENTEGQVETPPAEPEGEKPEGEEDEVSPAKARRERRKAEMERLREAAREANAEVERVRQRLTALEQHASQEQPPKEDDFSDYTEYLMALAAHKSTAALDARQKREIEEEARTHQQRIDDLQRQEQQEIAQNWASQVEEAKGRYADFESVVYTAPISDRMAEVIASSDVGADVAYYLGTHRDEAARVSRMSDLDMARQIGAIEARLAMPQAKSVTETPDPIRPVRPKATAAKDPSKMSYEEYKAARSAGKI